ASNVSTSRPPFERLTGGCTSCLMGMTGSASRRWLGFQRDAAFGQPKIPFVSEAGDRGQTLHVKQEDPLALRICEAQPPPVGKDPAHGIRRRDHQLGQILARKRHVDGETANRLASYRLGEPQQEPGEPLFHARCCKVLEASALL